MSDYDEMLKRLQAYRKSLGLKQRQICKTVGVTQEQYSYLENGLVKLTDDNLKALYGIGLDLDYLITGKEYDYTAEDLDILLSEFEESHKDFVMKMIAEVIVEKWSRGSLRQDMPEEALKMCIFFRQRSSHGIDFQWWSLCVRTAIFRSLI